MSALIRGGWVVGQIVFFTRNAGQSRFALLQARRLLRGSQARRTDFPETLPLSQTSRLGVRRGMHFSPASFPGKCSGIQRRARRGSTGTTYIATLPSPSVVNRRSGQWFRLFFCSVDKDYMLSDLPLFVKPVVHTKISCYSFASEPRMDIYRTALTPPYVTCVGSFSVSSCQPIKIMQAKLS